MCRAAVVEPLEGIVKPHIGGAEEAEGAEHKSQRSQKGRVSQRRTLNDPLELGNDHKSVRAHLSIGRSLSAGEAITGAALPSGSVTASARLCPSAISAICALRPPLPPRPQERTPVYNAPDLSREHPMRPFTHLIAIASILLMVAAADQPVQSQSPPAQGTWAEKAKLGEQRTEAGVVAVNGRIFVLGGMARGADSHVLNQEYRSGHRSLARARADAGPPQPSRRCGS